MHRGACSNFLRLQKRKKCPARRYRGERHCKKSVAEMSDTPYVDRANLLIILLICFSAQPLLPFFPLKKSATYGVCGADRAEEESGFCVCWGEHGMLAWLAGDPTGDDDDVTHDVNAAVTSSTEAAVEAPSSESESNEPVPALRCGLVLGLLLDLLRRLNALRNELPICVNDSHI